MSKIKAICSFCKNFNYIVFEDYSKPTGKIRACYDCFSLWNQPEALKFEQENKGLLEKEKFLKIDCGKCKQRFLPKFLWQKTCTACYLKTKKTKSNEVKPTQEVLF